MKRNSLLLSSVLIAATILLSPGLTSPSHGTLAGLVCLVQPAAASCPSSPAPLSGSSGGQLRVSVFIQDSEGITGFDVTLLADHTTIRPVGVDMSGSILPGTPIILTECLQGILIQGTACYSTDTIDTLHFTAVSPPGTPPTTAPTSGLLFTAIYNITGSTPGITIAFQSGCGPSTSAPPDCVSISNGTANAVSESTQIATFTTQSNPYFVASANPRTLTVSSGSSISSTVSVTGLNGFSGNVTLTISEPIGLSANLSQTNIALAENQTSSSSLSITADSALLSGAYLVTVTGTSGSISNSVPITVTVNSPPPPTIMVSTDPQIVTIQAGHSGTSMITLASVNGFNGTVSLSAVYALSSPFNVSLSPTTVVVSPGVNGTSLMTIHTSRSTPAHGYSILIIGRSGSIFGSTGVSIIVTPPPDFTITASPTNQTLTKASSITYTITIQGTNGFNSTLSLQATISPIVHNTPTVSLPSTAGPYSNATLTVYTTRTTLKGTYTITLTASAGVVSHSLTVTLEVTK